MAAILAVIAGLLGLNVLIILHELGHFIVAKRNGVAVEEFGLGLPPRLTSRVMGRGFWRCRYSLNWLPIGGFVRLKGEGEGDLGPGSFRQASLKVRLKILLAGVLVNFLVAGVLLTILATISLPRLLPVEPFFADRQQWSVAADTYTSYHDVRLNFVADGSAAAEAGLAVGDRLMTVDGQSIASLAHLQAELAAANESVTLTTTSARVEIEPTRLLANLGADYRPQLAADELVFEVQGWSAPVTGSMLAVQYSQVMLESLGRVVVLLVSGSPNEAGELVSGPVGALHAIELASEQSWVLTIMIMAFISLSLAIMNLLPIPALDGGRAVLAIWVEKVRRRPLTAVVESRLQLGSFVVLLFLLVLLTFLVDLPRLI